MAKGLWEPDFERVLTVLRRDGEPDRVPFLELFHDPEIVAGVMGAAWPAEPAQWQRTRIDFSLKLGYDYVVGTHTFGFTDIPTLVSDDTADLSRGQRGWEDEHHGPIGDWQAFEEYPWPRIEQASFADLEGLAAILPDGMKITATLPGGVLENLISLLGYTPLCMHLVDDPDLVQATVDRVGEALMAVYRVLCDMDFVGAVWLNDDMGFKTQTLVSPNHLRQYVFPWQKRLVEYAHAHGKLVMLHACGNLSQVMEDIIEDVRVDAKHSFEDVIQPVAEFKRRYGSRIAALGGVDVHVLASGTVDEVRAYTERVIADCAPGGGWTLGSGNSLANYIPIPNFLAMLEVGRQAGVYRR